MFVLPFLSITMFREVMVGATKHCSAHKNPNIPKPNITKRCTAQIIHKQQNPGTYGFRGALSPKF